MSKMMTWSWWKSCYDGDVQLDGQVLEGGFQDNGGGPGETENQTIDQNLLLVADELSLKICTLLLHSIVGLTLLHLHLARIIIRNDVLLSSSSDTHVVDAEAVSRRSLVHSSLFRAGEVPVHVG